MNRETSRPNLDWLKRYYIVRALFSALWVVLALALGKAHPVLGLGLMIAYPAWDSLANYVDAQQSGGFRSNPTQMVNVLVSAIVTLAIAAAATRNFHAVIAVVGVWATLAGILQLWTAARRWPATVALASWEMSPANCMATTIARSTPTATWGVCRRPCTAPSAAGRRPCRDMPYIKREPMT